MKKAKVRVVKQEPSQNKQDVIEKKTIESQEEINEKKEEEEFEDSEHEQSYQIEPRNIEKRNISMNEKISLITKALNSHSQNLPLNESFNQNRRPIFANTPRPDQDDVPEKVIPEFDHDFMANMMNANKIAEEMKKQKIQENKEYFLIPLGSNMKYKISKKTVYIGLLGIAGLLIASKYLYSYNCSNKIEDLIETEFDEQ